MKTPNYFKKIINRIKFKKQFLLDSPKDLYSDLISKPEISNIINNMPENLSQIEKAYYLYIELGKIVTYNYKFYVLGRNEEIYNSNVDDSYSGICKSLSELNEEKRYVEKSSEELKEFINQFDKDSLRLTNFNFLQINEDLELE